MSRVLNRYLAREVTGATVLVFSALLILYSFFDLIHELKDLGKGGYRLGHIFLYVILSLPGHVYELFPIAVLIGTLYALTQLAAHSELTVMRVSGMDIPAMAWALLRVGIILVIVNFLFGEVIVPFSERLAQTRQLEAMKSLVATQFRSGLWVKDDKIFINVQEMMPDTTLVNLKVYDFDPGYKLKSISFAKRGVYEGNQVWRVTDVEQTIFDGDHVTLNQLRESKWKSVLTPDMLGALLLNPEQMSVWKLFTYIQHLRDNSQKTIRYEVALWSKLTYPFAILVMMSLALPFSFYQRRIGGVGGRIFLGVMLGLGFHVLNRLFSDLGVLNDWNPILCSIMPSVLFLLLAFGMMYWVEKR